MAFKIRDDDIPLIIKMYDEEQYEIGYIAEKFNVKPVTITRILARHGFIFGTYNIKPGRPKECIGIVRDKRGVFVESYNKKGGA